MGGAWTFVEICIIPTSEINDDDDLDVCNTADFKLGNVMWLDTVSLKKVS